MVVLYGAFKSFACYCFLFFVVSWFLVCLFDACCVCVCSLFRRSLLFAFVVAAAVVAAVVVVVVVVVVVLAAAAVCLFAFIS